MFPHNLIRAVRNTVLGLLLASGASLASAETYHIEIDTSGFGSGAGWLDFQFGPSAAGNAAAALASISNLSGAFSPGVSPEIDGAVSGSLADGYQIANSIGLNAVMSSIMLGGKFSFDVSFSGAGASPANRNGSGFSLGLYDLNYHALGQADPLTNSLLQFTWTPSPLGAQYGSASLTQFDNVNVGVSAVPEPAEWLMLLVGVAALACVARRQGAQAPRLDALPMLAA